eukprot:795124-Prymnesium_polylepis.1
MLPGRVTDTHALPHSGDCIAELPVKTGGTFRIMFDRKNYDASMVQQKEVDRAVRDGNAQNIDAIVLVYSRLPKYTNDLMILKDTEQVCTMARLSDAVVQMLMNYKEIPPPSAEFKEFVTTMSTSLAPELDKRFEELSYWLYWFHPQTIEAQTREFQAHFLKTKRMLQAPPCLDEKQALRDVFEKHFSEKGKGNFILDSRKKRKFDEGAE